MRFVASEISGWYWCTTDSAIEKDPVVATKFAATKAVGLAPNGSVNRGFRIGVESPIQVKASQERVIREHVEYLLQSKHYNMTHNYHVDVNTIRGALRADFMFSDRKQVKYPLNDVVRLIWKMLIDNRSEQNNMTNFVNASLRCLLEYMVYVPSGKYFVDPRACAYLLVQETRLSKSMLELLDKGETLVDAFVKSHGTVVGEERIKIEKLERKSQSKVNKRLIKGRKAAH